MAKMAKKKKILQSLQLTNFSPFFCDCGVTAYVRKSFRKKSGYSHAIFCNSFFYEFQVKYLRKAYTKKS